LEAARINVGQQRRYGQDKSLDEEKKRAVSQENPQRSADAMKG
jgi:hypothetical protein